MKTTISAAEMRKRLMAGLKRPATGPDDWVTVLGSAKNRALLSLIGQFEPKSIGELADLAGRAQPNVSRSLSALDSAGLITVATDGRRSVPALTKLGREKAGELGLLTPGQVLSQQSVSGGSWLRLDFDKADGDRSDFFADEDAVPGTLVAELWTKGASEASFATWSGDLSHWATGLIAEWWRLLYRRDAPLRFLEVAIAERHQRGTLSVRSGGQFVRLLARGVDGGPLELDRRYVKMPVEEFERDLLESWLQPISQQQRRMGRLDRPLQSALARLLDSRSDPAENAFCRTAGALGVSPYVLDDVHADLVRRLLHDIEDEDARLDFASAVLSEELEAGLLWARNEVEVHRTTNAIPGLAELREESHGVSNDRSLRPYGRGRALARFVRSKLNLASDKPLQGAKGLAQLLQVEQFKLSSDAPGAVRGFQSLVDKCPVIIVEDEGPTSTTFILSRAIGDFLAFGSRSACVANIYTDRQAVGRAFAAELIAPAEGVVAMVEEGQPSYKIEHHYGASQEVVRRQYENYGT